MSSEFNMSAWLDGKSEGRYEFPILKFQDGVTYQVRILDAVPVKRYVHFKSVKDRTVVCPGIDKCLFCMRGEDAAVNASHINVIDRMDGKVKVLRFYTGKGFGLK